MADKIKSPCRFCEFPVLHDPETRPAEYLICVDCTRKGKTVQHLAEQVAEEVLLSPGDADSESGPDRKEPNVTDTDTVQEEKATEATEQPAEKSTEQPKQKKQRKPVEERRARGLLEADVLTVTDKFVQGKLNLEDDKPLTPHRIARLIQKQDGLDEPPSTGAVSAVLDRWNKYGFANVSTKPTAFQSYTDAGVNEGLTALKEQHSAKLKAQRAAAKEAKEKEINDAADSGDVGSDAG